MKSDFLKARLLCLFTSSHLNTKKKIELSEAYSLKTYKVRSGLYYKTFYGSNEVELG